MAMHRMLQFWQLIGQPPRISHIFLYENSLIALKVRTLVI